MLTLAEADAELQRLTLLKKNHLDEQYVARRRVRDLPDIIAGQSERLAKLTDDEATTKAHARDPVAIGGRTYPSKDLPEALGATLDALPWTVSERTRFPLGQYKGLRFGVVFHPQFPPNVYLEGATTHTTMLSKEHQGPRAILNALERLATGYGEDIDRVRQDQSIAEGQLRDYQARLGRPFTHDAYLIELTALRDQLKARLTSTAHEPEESEEPSAPQLAERIKALRTANTIEASQQRDRPKHSTAEEPITARIRRRQEQAGTGTMRADEETNPDDESLSPEIESGSMKAMPQSFHDRIRLERQTNGEGQSPS